MKLSHSLTRKNRSHFFRTGIVSFALIAGLVGACAENEVAETPEVEEQPNTTAVETEETTDAAPTLGENVTIDEVNNDLGQLVGRNVTVRSEAETTPDPNSFRLVSEAFFSGENVIVFNATGEPFVLPEEDDIEVQATGEVRQFILTDVEREYGLDLNPEVYTEYESQPVIFAESLAIAPDPGEVTEDPAAFYNEQIAIEGEVGEVTSPTVFTMEDEALFGGENLLVISPTPVSEELNGQAVTVTGQLRPFVVADIEREYGLDWDLDLEQQLEAEYQERPVFIADSIYPSAQ